MSLPTEQEYQRRKKEMNKSRVDSLGKSKGSTVNKLREHRKKTNNTINKILDYRD